MIRATDSSAGMMMDHTIIYLRMNTGELLMSKTMICSRNSLRDGTQNLRPLLPFWQQQRNFHHIFSPIQIFPRPNPISLLLIRGFNSRMDYAKLGLPENASKAEVKSAYFSLAKKLHPDNGGNAKKFNEVTEAYKRLTSDSGYPPGYGGQSQYDRSQYSGSNQDPSWMEEMERRRRARMWMEQRMMEEEWARRRAQQKHWQNYQSGRVNHERAKLVRAFMMPLMIMMMGSMVFFQMLFYSITPSGCSQYEQGCSCNKCTEHERFMRQLGGPRYSRTGHQRGCECQVCVTTGFQYLQHPPNCKCQTCRTNF